MQDPGDGKPLRVKKRRMSSSDRAPREAGARSLSHATERARTSRVAALHPRQASAEPREPQHPEKRPHIRLVARATAEVERDVARKRATASPPPPAKPMPRRTLGDVLGSMPWLQEPWEAPSAKKAKEAARREVLWEGRANVAGTGSREFDEASLGLGLHFRLLRYYIGFFAVACIIGFPMLVLSLAGSRLQAGRVDVLGLARLSIANVGDKGPVGNYTVAPWPGNQSMRYGAGDVSAIIMACDFLIIAVFIVFTLWVRWRVRKIAQVVEEAQVTGSDYTVYVRGLPRDATEAEIRDHFSKLYNLYEQDWTYMSSWRHCFLNRKMVARPKAKQPPPEVLEVLETPHRYEELLAMRQVWAIPVHDASYNGDPSYIGSWVADVAMAGPAREAVYALRTRAQLLLELERCKAAARRYHRTTGSTDTDSTDAKHEQLPAVYAKQVNSGLRQRRRPKRAEGTQLPESATSSEENELTFRRMYRMTWRGLQACGRSLQAQSRQCSRACWNWIESGDTKGRDTEDDADLDERQRRKRRAFALAALFAAAKALVAFDRKHPSVPGSMFQGQAVPEKRPADKPRVRMNTAMQRCLRRVFRIQGAESTAKRDDADSDKPNATGCVGAFVTFQNGESVRRCLEDYEPSEATFLSNPYAWMRYLVQPPVLRFRGKHHLHVVRASDPTLVLWENLEVTPMQKAIRQAFVGVLVFILLLACFTVVVITQAKVKELQTTIPSVALCDTVLPAVAFKLNITGDGEVPDLATALPNGAALKLALGDYTCGLRAQYRIGWHDNNGVRLPLSSPFNSNPCLNECVPPEWFSRPQLAPMCKYPTQTPGVNATYASSSTVTCFCYGKLRSAIASQGILAGSSQALADDRGVCQPALFLMASSYALMIIASLITVVTNNLLRYAIRVVSEFEAHYTIDELYRAIATKSFIAIFINTSVVVLLLNAAMPPPLSDVRIDGTKLFDGTFDGFELAWHISVGASICLNMMFNSLSQHIGFFLEVLVIMPCARLCLRTNNAFTQEQLNERFSPEHFELQTRTAFTMATLFSCLMYSAGHPILLFIGCGSFIIAYWVDKFSILKVYRKPPVYGATLARWQITMLPLAGAVHLIVAIWMYSQPGVLLSIPVGLARAARRAGDFVSRQSDSLQTVLSGGSSADSWMLYDSVQDAVISRLSQQNTLPLVVLLAFIAAAALVYYVVGRPLLALLRVLAFAMCRRCSCYNSMTERVSASACLRRCKKLLGLRDDDSGASLPLFTCVFRRLVHCNKTHEQPRIRAEQGWRLIHAFRKRDWLMRFCEDESARAKVGKRDSGDAASVASHTHAHSYASEGGGPRHVRVMRTFEVLGTVSLRSYRLRDNPAYAVAFKDLAK